MASVLHRFAFGTSRENCTMRIWPCCLDSSRILPHMFSRSADVVVSLHVYMHNRNRALPLLPCARMPDRMTCDLGVSVLYDSDTVLRERLMFPQYCLGSTSAATTTNDSASGMLENAWARTTRHCTSKVALGTIAGSGFKISPYTCISTA